VHTEKMLLAPAACCRIQASTSVSSIQGFLTKAARHMKDIQRLRIGQGRIGHQPQSLQIANGFGCLAIDAICRVRNAVL
jgi:hypothetical protein